MHQELSPVSFIQWSLTGYKLLLRAGPRPSSSWWTQNQFDGILGRFWLWFLVLFGWLVFDLILFWLSIFFSSILILKVFCLYIMVSDFVFLWDFCVCWHVSVPMFLFSFPYFLSSLFLSFFFFFGFFSVCLFCPIQVCLFFPYSNFFRCLLFSNERGQERIWIWVSGEDLGGFGGEKTIIRIYFMEKKNTFGLSRQGFFV